MRRAREKAPPLPTEKTTSEGRYESSSQLFPAIPRRPRRREHIFPPTAADHSGVLAVEFVESLLETARMGFLSLG
jgi:hypothetical protein